ncbi:hypothetical protein U1Q18_019819 [Sarracenia purpurea var. burkii]
MALNVQILCRLRGELRCGIMCRMCRFELALNVQFMCRILAVCGIFFAVQVLLGQSLHCRIYMVELIWRIIFGSFCLSLWSCAMECFDFGSSCAALGDVSFAAMAVDSWPARDAVIRLRLSSAMDTANSVSWVMYFFGQSCIEIWGEEHAVETSVPPKDRRRLEAVGCGGTGRSSTVVVADNGGHWWTQGLGSGFLLSRISGKWWCFPSWVLRGDDVDATLSHPDKGVMGGVRRDDPVFQYPAKL